MKNLIKALLYWLNFDPSIPVLKPVKSFDELSPAEKRVAIAKDVLEQIRVCKYIPYTGSYVYSDGIPEGSIKDNFDKIERCQVCAWGAGLLSIVHFKNELTRRDVFNDRFRNEDAPAIKLIASLFEPYQIALIEGAFEGYYNNDCHRIGKVLGVDKVTEEDEEKIYQFSIKYYTGERLIAIYQNIIDNNGTFIP